MKGPWYKLVIQLGVGLNGIQNLGPVALGCLYPVETSTRCITYACCSLPSFPIIDFSPLFSSTYHTAFVLQKFQRSYTSHCPGISLWDS